MSNLKQTVTDFLNDNSAIAEALMREAEYQQDWSSENLAWRNDTPLPFEYKPIANKGGEGEGDEYYQVIEVRDPTNQDETLLVKLYGWWVSYDGSNYSGWQFVTPRQKTITVYD